MRTVILLVPSRAAAVELPRRVAAAGQPLAGVIPFTLGDLVRAVAEPELLLSGLKAWDTGHDALVAARALDDAEDLHLPDGVPRAVVAGAVARTLAALRGAGVTPERLDDVARRRETPEDRARLAALARLYRAFQGAVEGRFADPATLLRAAAARLASTPWLVGAEVVLVDDFEPTPLELDVLRPLAERAQLVRLRRECPGGLVSPLAAWAEAHKVRAVSWEETALGPAAPAPTPAALRRVKACLFEPPVGEPAPRDGSVELITAPGEAAEVRSIARRLLRQAAAGVPFEEMAIALPRPQEYAPLVTDLLTQLGIPHRMHPSLPLRFGRSARSLLLLLRCRGLSRAAVMEFLTFAPIAFAELLGEEATPRPAQWDAISRDAQIVSGLDRWMVGLRYHAETEREAAAKEEQESRRERRLRRAADAEALLRLVELLSATLDALAGEATWGEWSQRLAGAFDQWIAPERDREATAGVIADLAGLAHVSPRARWSQVEEVLEARLEWERLPLPPVVSGAVHVGVLDAIAGLPFRVLAIPGLVEGGYPGVVRPDPFLLDEEREALGFSPAPASSSGQLSLFDAEVSATRLPTSQDRLLEARRAFHRALSQASERLILSYPRADPRSGRERLPSLFFVAAASAREGRPLSAAELEALVSEDDLDLLPLEDALDGAERDRLRVRRSGHEASLAVAGGSAFFRQSRLASQARWSNRLTAYDGLVMPLPAALAQALDPVTAERPISASRLAAFSRCGFQYLLQYVLRLEPAFEPEERQRLDPLERGSLFHELAEAYLRERRDKGELPLQDTPEVRARLTEMAEAALDGFVAGSPPRFQELWEREKARFKDAASAWLEREIQAAGRSTPAHFEVAFGLPHRTGAGEPHHPEPLTIELGDGRTLRISGQIDRIDRREDGLVIRDYKTGKAPRDETGSLFRGAKQLQIPFYVLAAERLFPGERVAEAFLDYVDGGRQVGMDPEVVRGEGFKTMLRGLVDAIAQGLFVQEPSACEWCDYKEVCGPRGLLERRRQIKIGDSRVQRVLRLRDLA